MVIGVSNIRLLPTSSWNKSNCKYVLVDAVRVDPLNIYGAQVRLEASGLEVTMRCIEMYRANHLGYNTSAPLVSLRIINCLQLQMSCTWSMYLELDQSHQSYPLHKDCELHC